MDNYKSKFLYLAIRQNWQCPIATKYGYSRICTELHHKLHNTKVNRKKYPLFIHSLLNLVAVNHDMHMAHPSYAKISNLQAGKYEAFLKRHPKIYEFVNGNFDIDYPEGRKWKYMK